MASSVVRIVVESKSMRLVLRAQAALEDAEMAGALELLMERLGGGAAIETVVRHGCLRVALRPFAELALRELLEIAEREDLSVATRERLARRVMRAAGYA